MNWSFSHFCCSAAFASDILFCMLKYVWFVVLLVVFVVVYAFFVLSLDFAMDVHMSRVSISR